MALLRRSIFALLLGALPLACSQTTTQAPATTATDGENPRFMGFYLAPDSTERLTVTEGSVWATRGNYAAECEDPNDLAGCRIPTACVNSRLSFDDGSSQNCNQDFDCATMRIYQTSPFGGPAATNFNCRIAWVAHTVYRQLVETMIPTATPTSTTGAPTPTNTNPIPEDEQDSGSNLGPALGGGIGGAVALIGLAGLGIFLYRRKKRATAAQQAQASDKDPAYFTPGPGNGYPGSVHQMPNESGNGYPNAAYPNSGYPSTPGGWSSVPTGSAPYTPYGGTYNSVDGKYYYGNGAPFLPNQDQQYTNKSPPSELGDGRGQQSPQTLSGPYAGARQVPGLPAELPGSEFAVEAPSPQTTSRPDAPGTTGTSTMPVFTSSRMNSMQSSSTPLNNGARESSISSGGGSNGISLLLGSPEPRV